MSHPVDQAASATLDELRRLDYAGPVVANAHMTRGVYLSWDEAAAGNEFSFSSRPGHLIALDLKVGEDPNWLTLNVEIGAARFEVGDILVLIADLSCSHAKELEMFVRTGRSWGDRDTELQEPLTCSKDAAITTALHTINSSDNLAGEEGFHTLVIKLPKSSGRLDIQDFRLFVVPAEVAKRVSPDRLGSFT